jgi:putative membrane protein (TIGR04086 family)
MPVWVRLGAVGAGVAAGSLLSTLVGLVVWPVLELLDLEGAAQTAITLGVVGGLFGGGFISGRMVTLSYLFHGALTGLGMAALILVVARLGGSPAPTPQVLWLAILAITLGGMGALLGGRRRAGKM